MDGELTIVGLGEALWDMLPGGKVLGGAPLNVACHVHALLEDRGGAAVVASRVGTDALGDAVIDELVRRGLETDYVQRDALHSTSTVTIALKAGQPTYTFTPDIAWDHLEFTPAWAELAERCDAVCFGTLAQRSPRSRETIWQFLSAAPQAVRLFDINLRQGFYDQEALLEGCRLATLVKLNDQELAVLADLLALPAGSDREQLERIRARFGLEAVIYTRGVRGTLLILADGVVDPRPVKYPAGPAADAVGAGDACSAGILTGWLLRLPPERTAELANHLGAFVASQPGATPDLPRELIARAG